LTPDVILSEAKNLSMIAIAILHFVQDDTTLRRIPWMKKSIAF